MKTLNFDFDLKDSQDLSMGKASEAIAMALERSIIQERGVIIKYFDWALQLRKEPYQIEVDDSDLRKLNEFIDTTQYLIAGAKYRLIKYLESVK